MRRFALSVTAELLTEAIAGIRRAAESPHAEHVHKMRVGIRRFQQSLRLFRQFFRPKGVKKVRRSLHHLMDHAGELRNHDVAMGLVRGAREIRQEISARRMIAKRAFQRVLAEIAQPDLEAKWRRQLGMEGYEQAREEAVEG